MIPALAHIAGAGASEWKISGLGTSVPSAVGPHAISGDQPATETSGSSSGAGFGNVLTKAIGSLETTQTNATQASEQLATGQLSDPTQAITSVENASLAMDFASQLRTQLDTAATTIFQTQL